MRVIEKGATVAIPVTLPACILAGSLTVSETSGIEMNSTLDGWLLGIDIAGSNENVSPEAFSRISVVRAPDRKIPPSTGK
jgi:hypothetical protein